jgi:hypothetical protein
MMRSGHTRGWLRQRFPEWERAGNALRHGRQRVYRMLVIPQGADTTSAKEAGRRAGARRHPRSRRGQARRDYRPVVRGRGRGGAPRPAAEAVAADEGGPCGGGCLGARVRRDALRDRTQTRAAHAARAVGSLRGCRVPAASAAQRALYLEHWRRWELFCGREFIAEDARQETVDRLRARLTTLGIAVGHQQRIVRDVKTVYAWGDSRELLARNRLAGYRFKVAKDARAPRPAAYTRDEIEAVLAELRPQVRGEWRPWCVLVLAAYQGARERAILHLQDRGRTRAAAHARGLLRLTHGAVVARS